MDTDFSIRRGEPMKTSATIVRRPTVATGLLDQAGELLLVAIDGVYLSEPVALRLHPDEVQAVVDRSSDASETIEAERAWSSAAIEAMQSKPRRDSSRDRLYEQVGGDPFGPDSEEW